MCRWIRLFAWCAMLGAWSVGFERLASAADKNEDELLHQGVEARRRRDEVGALALFRQAYLLHQSPRAVGQMGLAEVALGRWVAAEEHLEEAISAHGDPWIQKNLKTLEATMARVHQEVGLIDVLGPEGAEVVIGGEVRGTLPLRQPIYVRVGDVHVELRAVGRVSETRTLKVVAGELTRETVEMSSLPPSPPRVSANLVTDGRSPTETKVSSSPATGARAPGAGGGLRATGVVLTCLGVATVGAGVAFGLKARSSGNADSAAPMFDPNGEKDGQRFQTLQWVGYGIGAALLVGGVTTYLIGASRREDASPQVAFVATRGMALAAFQEAF